MNEWMNCWKNELWNEKATKTLNTPIFWSKLDSFSCPSWSFSENICLSDTSECCFWDCCRADANTFFKRKSIRSLNSAPTGFCEISVFQKNQFFSFKLIYSFFTAANVHESAANSEICPCSWFHENNEKMDSQDDDAESPQSKQSCVLWDSRCPLWCWVLDISLWHQESRKDEHRWWWSDTAEKLSHWNCHG